MGDASYRIGPSDFFLPSDLKADADTLNTQSDLLDSTIDGNEDIPEVAWNGFWLWRASWKKFYSEHFSGTLSTFATALNDGNRDQLISFENQFLDWAGQFAGYGAALPGSLVKPSTGAKDNLANQLGNYLGIDASTIVIVLVVVVAAWFFVRRAG